MEENLKRKAQKLLNNNGDEFLTQLEATLDVVDKLQEVADAIKSIPETVIPEVIIPDQKDVVFPYVQKVEVMNQAPVVKVDAPIVNLPAPIVNVEAPIVDLHQEEVISELQNIANILSKEEEKSIDKTEIVNAKGETVDIEKLLQTIADRVSNIRISGGGGSFPYQSQMDLSALAAVYTTRVDKTTEAGVVYIGKATIASSQASPAWQISKVDTDAVSIMWADGNANFDNVWNDRTSLTYL